MYTQPSSQNSSVARTPGKIFANAQGQKSEVALDAVSEMIAEGLIAGKTQSQIATAILQRFPSLSADSVAEVIRRLANLQQTATAQPITSLDARLPAQNASEQIFQDMGARFQVAWSVDGMQALAREVRSVNLARTQIEENVARQRQMRSPVDDFWDTFYYAKPRFLLFKMAWQTVRLTLRMPPRLAKMAYHRLKNGPAPVAVVPTAEGAPVVALSPQEKQSAIETPVASAAPASPVAEGPLLGKRIGLWLLDRDAWKRRIDSAWSAVRSIKLPSVDQIRDWGTSTWQRVRSIRLPRSVSEFNAAASRICGRIFRVAGSVITSIWMVIYRRLPSSWQARLKKAGDQLRREFLEIFGYWKQDEPEQPVVVKRVRKSSEKARVRRASASAERPTAAQKRQSEEKLQAAIDSALDLDDQPPK